MTSLNTRFLLLSNLSLSSEVKESMTLLEFNFFTNPFISFPIVRTGTTFKHMRMEGNL
jgi:hypothetical protein